VLHGIVKLAKFDNTDMTNKKYAIAGTVKGRRSKSVAAISPSGLAISAGTTLVSTEKASEILKSDRGLDLSKVVIQRRCASGQWKQGIHWVKAGKQYLIHMDAVFELIVAGTV
jgi:hypothetical protein